VKFGTAIGIVISCVGIAMGATMEGTNVAVVLNVPAILIVLVGTLGATIAACGLQVHMKLPQLFKKAIMPEDLDLVGRVNEIVGYAEKARRDGLLALDEAVNSVEDPFMKKGLQMAVDGTDPDDLYEILAAEAGAKRASAAAGAQFWMDAGGYSPTIGIIGTVLGLIHVLENLSQPDKLGHLIAGAFVATLWGVLSANALFLPFGKRIKVIGNAEAARMDVIIEGVLAIQSGANPRVVATRLRSKTPAPGPTGVVSAKDAA